MPERDAHGGWDATLADLEQRRAAGRAMGGDERLAKHHAAGKLDARARIDALVDPGSFLELGTLTGGESVPAEAIVLGSGRVSGRPVIVAAEDFTVLAGTISHTSNSKRFRAAELAVRDRVPLVMMLDGAGFRADGKAYGRAPTDLLAQSRCSGHVPLITAVSYPKRKPPSAAATLKKMTRCRRRFLCAASTNAGSYAVASRSAFAIVAMLPRVEVSGRHPHGVI